MVAIIITVHSLLRSWQNMVTKAFVPIVTQRMKCLELELTNEKHVAFSYA